MDKLVSKNTYGDAVVYTITIGTHIQTYTPRGSFINQPNLEKEIIKRLRERARRVKTGINKILKEMKQLEKD